MLPESPVSRFLPQKSHFLLLLHENSNPQTPDCPHQKFLRKVFLPSGFPRLLLLFRKLSPCQVSLHTYPRHPPQLLHPSSDEAAITLHSLIDESMQTAWEEIPSPLPVNPSPSSVVAFTLT